MHSYFQWITRDVSNLVNGCFFVVTFVYGLNIFTGCQTLWHYLLGHAIAFLSKSWLILRDFNDIMSTSNKCGGDLTWHRHLNNFGNYVYAAKLVKVPYSVLKYTWHNSQHSRGIIIEKLDWIFGNSCWFSTWPFIFFSIQVYCCSMFTLPYYVIRRINSLVVFLYKDYSLSHLGAKIA